MELFCYNLIPNKQLDLILYHEVISYFILLPFITVSFTWWRVALTRHNKIMIKKLFSLQSSEGGIETGEGKSKSNVL